MMFMLDVLEGLEDPISEHVPLCSHTQTLMRAAGNTAPSCVLTASNSCDSQKGAVC